MPNAIRLGGATAAVILASAAVTIFAPMSTQDKWLCFALVVVLCAWMMVYVVRQSNEAEKRRHETDEQWRVREEQSQGRHQELLERFARADAAIENALTASRANDRQAGRTEPSESTSVLQRARERMLAEIEAERRARAKELRQEFLPPVSVEHFRLAAKLTGKRPTEPPVSEHAD
jgi:hypothetical protein